MKKKMVLLFILSLILFSCRGKQGPMGPMGPGLRIIYVGTATTDEYEVVIPELHIDDMPAISIYYLLDGAWSELYVDYDDAGTAVFPYALIEEQLVTLFNLAGLDFQIVLIL